jgi:hypothetical protein
MAFLQKVFQTIQDHRDKKKEKRRTSIAVSNGNSSTRSRAQLTNDEADTERDDGRISIDFSGLHSAKSDLFSKNSVNISGRNSNHNQHQRGANKGDIYDAINFDDISVDICKKRKR